MSSSAYSSLSSDGDPTFATAASKTKKRPVVQQFAAWYKKERQRVKRKRCTTSTAVFQAGQRIVAAPYGVVSEFGCQMPKPERKRGKSAHKMSTQAEERALSLLSQQINVLPDDKIKSILEILDESQKLPTGATKTVTDMQLLDPLALRSLQQYVRGQTNVRNKKNPLQRINALQQSLNRHKMRNKFNGGESTEIMQLEKKLAAVQEWQSAQMTKRTSELDLDDHAPSGSEAFPLAERRALLEQIKLLPERQQGHVLEIIRRTSRTIDHGNGWSCHVILPESISDYTFQLLRHYVQQQQR